jgi:hypothetical protein
MYRRTLTEICGASQNVSVCARRKVSFVVWLDRENKQLQKKGLFSVWAHIPWPVAQANYIIRHRFSIEREMSYKLYPLSTLNIQLRAGTIIQ